MYMVYISSESIIEHGKRLSHNGRVYLDMVKVSHGMVKSLKTGQDAPLDMITFFLDMVLLSVNIVKVSLHSLKVSLYITKV
jgi:hypothetical protein